MNMPVILDYFSSLYYIWQSEKIMLISSLLKNNHFQNFIKNNQNIKLALIKRKSFQLNKDFPVPQTYSIKKEYLLII
jgi:hypothetical protein